MKSIFKLFFLVLLPSCILVADTQWGPTPRRSFGPNGTHWPSNLPTPYPYHPDSVNFVSKYVACSWSAITKAVTELTLADIDKGVIIYVEPGTLTGFGAGSTSTAVLKALGSTSWTKRVTIVPKNGYGSVTVTGGARYSRLYGINIAGFIYDSLSVGGCTNSAVSWSFVSTRGTVTGDPELVTQNVEIVEVIYGDKVELDGNDRFVVSTVGADISNFSFIGCYFAPKRRPDSSPAHTDTFQFGASKGGTYSRMNIIDCAVFGSDNTAVQTGSIVGLILRHTFLCASDAGRTRYPYLPGGDQLNANHVFNGGGQELEAHDCVFSGAETIQSTIVTQSWSNVRNTRISTGFSVNGGSPIQGSFTVDSGLGGMVLKNDFTAAESLNLILRDTFNTLTATDLAKSIINPLSDYRDQIWKIKPPVSGSISISVSVTP